MLRENEFVDIGNMSNQEKWVARQRYRNMSNLEKKRISSHLTKFKQKLNFSQWWSYIGERVKEGRKKHLRNKKNIRRDPRSIKLAEEVKSDQFREYHKLK